jgi:fumarate reductase subunit D
LPRIDNSRSLPTESPEIVPLVVGLVGISIPVGLLALAAVGGSVIVLVLAVLAMVAVAAATLTFMFVLTDDGSEGLHDSADA